MNSGRQALVETFRNLSDEYLLERLRSGELTEIARVLAQEELLQRGLVAPARQPQAAAPEAAPGTVEWVTIARVLVPMDAHILRGRLEAEGIPALVADGNLVQTNSLLSVAVGGVRVQVPAPFVSQAREIMAAIGGGAFALREGAELESEDD
jgi:hypothetical protein